MALSGLTRILVAMLAMTAASGAFAAARVVQKPAAGVATPALPAVPPPPAFTVYDRAIDPATAAVRDALQTAGHAGPFLNKRDAAGVAEYYAEQGYVPTWTLDGKLSDRAVAIINRIAEADADGLDPKAYRTPPVDLGRAGAIPTPAALAEAEVMLSTAIVTYARHAYAGRLVPSEVDANFGYEQHLPDPVSVLTSVAGANDPVATLAAYNPPQKEFELLRQKLAELRGRKVEDKPVIIPAGPILKPGMSDPRIVLLRKRLGVTADTATPELYDEPVLAAVKAYQQSVKQKSDGTIGKPMLAALNRVGVDQIPLILANMERWRWMPRDLGNFYVRVDIPGFNLYVYQDDRIVFTTRIVVGKVDLQTPIFSNEIQEIVVNPSWNVPPSIIAKEYLPQLRNGGVPKGFQVLARVGGRFRPVDPWTINWSTVSASNLQLKQPPGERNALGVIKFLFPNKYAVYLHDTPAKALFQNDYRAYSHGCMRVQDPWGFAAELLTHEQGWSVASLKKLVGGPEKFVALPNKINVHITYFTAWVDDDGALQIRDDVYGHDARIEEAFGLHLAQG
jgi:murein L,D-transpeptidase YcbB/YkuD